MAEVDLDHEVGAAGEHLRAGTLRERREGVVDRRRSEQGHRGILVGPSGPFAHWARERRRATLQSVIQIPESDRLGALKIGPAVLVEGASGGPLTGTTFVAKDLYDVAGLPDRGRQPGLGADAPRARRARRRR